ncbi:hypothetical protein C8J57DRAFT_1283579 [Mycena rebaudengoi]|nr:hypothetical protein C8J57DRAFT_1283579 [Mycena rebaudengoi]
MPVPLWTGKAEARYNVTTEFPSLGLHSAAATGNVGLVEYALGAQPRGQPINSVLDGVLPLHAAAAGGNERVVKLLIERGADVNAPRLPRRYSNDKNRDTSAPIVGTSGSTPLHFAAANGNTNIVTTLLRRGAHPSRADKHGITPEMLARQNGWDECADVIKAWVDNKDRDLRERPGPDMDDPSGGVPLNRFASRDGSIMDESSVTRRRIHMKRSMDTALSMLTKGSPDASLKPPPLIPPSSSTGHLPATASASPPTTPVRPFGEYTFYPVSNSGSPSPIDPGSRRPSLPQITYPTTPAVNRKASLATRGPRRPRSAGNGADPEATSFNRSGSNRKLGTKYSLLNMFKKGQTETGSSEQLQSTSSVSVAPSGSALSSSSSIALAQPSPPINSSTESPVAPFMRRRLQSNTSPSPQMQQLPPQRSPSHPPIPPTSAVDFHNALQHQQRDRSGSAASSSFDPSIMGGVESGSPSSPSTLSRLGVFRSRNQSHVRDRSGSRGSSAGNRSGGVFDDDFVVAAGRPGILRAHNRSISGGAPPAPVRALRFDPSSSGNSRRLEEDASPSRGESLLGLHLRSSTSAGSLSRVRNEYRSAIQDGRDQPDSAPAAFEAFDLDALEKNFLEDDEEDEYAYGRPIQNSRLGLTVITPSVLSDPGLSVTSSQSSLSPVLSSGEYPDGKPLPPFPFSIHEPPPIPFDGKPMSAPPMGGALLLQDNRGRGDSVSSASTTDSHINPQLSASGTTSGSGSVTVTTPQHVSEALGPSPQGSPLAAPTDLENENEEGVQVDGLLAAPTHPRLHERRSQTPLDINLSLISSHAQAEALVQKVQQDILEMVVDSPNPKSVGYTPLSARLATYGETLALERKLRPSDTLDTPTEARPQSRLRVASRRPNGSQGHNGVDRQNSLDIHPAPARVRRMKEPKRPHTSSGTDSPSTESTPTHQSSRSTSAMSSLNDLRAPPVEKSATAPAEVAPHRLQRSLTPDGDPSRMSISVDGIESTDTELGPSLTRVATAPIPPTREKRDMARSTNKLTRMGFQPSQAAKQEAAAAAAAAAQNKRFGGFKSLMHSLKGKPA